MLNNVPANINKAARQVTLRHPNSMDCAVFRKRVERTASGSMGGLPTLGGLGVLDSEDESEVDWDDLGYAKLLMTDGGFKPSDLVDRADSADLSYPDVPCLIEPVADPSSDDYFTPKKHDIVYLFFGDDVKIAFEVDHVETDVLIPSRSVKYILQKRDLLSYINGFPPP